MHVQLFTTGGTFDKIYSDALSEFSIGKSMAPEILREANVSFSFASEGLAYKDSLELTEEDRTQIRNKVANCPHRHILITHGTDTMAVTAEALLGIPNKVVVLTGAMQPARMRSSDAHFNLGVAIGVLQLLPPGVYVAMNGQVFEAGKVRKNREAGRFETA